MLHIKQNSNTKISFKRQDAQSKYNILKIFFSELSTHVHRGDLFSATNPTKKIHPMSLLITSFICTYLVGNPHEVSGEIGTYSKPTLTGGTRLTGHLLIKILCLVIIKTPKLPIMLQHPLYDGFLVI